MPLIESAIKRMRQSRVRQDRRAPVKTHMKTMLRKVRDLSTAKKFDEAQKLLPGVYKAIDMAAKKHLIHPRNAARKKSLVARMVAASTK
jgi:small subunit ribosomal protein S20